MRRTLSGAALFIGLAASAPAYACACGCGVFEVGTSTLLPSGQGSTVFAEYDFMDQSKNWSGTGSAPAANNSDKNIRTDFFTVGAEKSFDEDWSAMVQVPVWDRLFKSDEGDGVESHRQTGLGDIRLMGTYSGLMSDHATGVIFGVKLPTGSYNTAGFDRDVAIGTGSTDALLGLTHSGPLAGSFLWYAQVLWDKPLATQDGYHPGPELDAALGTFYGAYAVGDVQITPMFQAIFATRARDGGAQGDPDNTGYTRLLVSPGIEVAYNAWKAYGDVEFPVYQDMHGNQLVAPVQFKFVLSYAVD